MSVLYLHTFVPYRTVMCAKVDAVKMWVCDGYAVF